MRIVFILLGILGSFSAFCQDVHLSHIHASPTYLNPAMNGMIHDGVGRVIVNSKSQWNTVTNAYKTAIASADMKVYGNKGTVIGLGLNLAADQAGDLDFTTIKTGLALSVIKSLDYRSENIISVGAEANYINTRFDISSMVGFEEEPLIALGLSNTSNYFTFSAGLSWFYNPNKETSFYFGGALSHFNQPDVTFTKGLSQQGIITTDFGATNLFTKFVFHTGGTFRISRNFKLLPSAIFTDQGPHQEILFGTFLRYANRASGPDPIPMYLGAWVRGYLEGDIRGSDAFVFTVRADIKKSIFALSYDFNVSTWKRASRGAGGVELSIIHILDLDKHSRKLEDVYCPGL